MGGTGTPAATSGGDGHESDEEGEEAVWPGEHTWAILTRVCFTLGNLTTTNAENRYDTALEEAALVFVGKCVLIIVGYGFYNRQLIGQKLGLADHLVMLLQVCRNI